MIAYNPKEWFSLIIRLHKADTVRLLFPTILAVSGYSLLIILIDIHWLQIAAESTVAKVSVMYSLLGFVISLLLVFRTNTAYERWWEGRKLWGSLMNCSRNLALKSTAGMQDHPAELLEIRKLVIHFPFALKNHLRNVNNPNDQELGEFLSDEEIKDHKHLPLLLSGRLYRKLAMWNRAGILSNDQFLVINLEAQQWMEICGACERIRNTPIPYSYSSFLKKFIFIYVMTLPITYAPVLGYLTILIVAFIFYVLASLEIIAEEIENPFGTDANDLPIDDICRNIRTSVEMVFEDAGRKG